MALPSSALLPSSVVLPEDGPLLSFVREILPLRRCITGDGLRETLDAIGRRVPLQITEVPSGTPLADWVAPREWRVREAYLATPDGERIADWHESPLHLVQYSDPVRTRMTFQALRPHLHSLPDQPGLVPYRTRYWADGWGFCLRHHDLIRLAALEGEFEVVIDAELFDGAMTLGECLLQGETEEEVLVSAHACHPALANDNASAMAVATALVEHLAGLSDRRYTYRILFAPGTIGSIAWMALNPEILRRVRAGLVLANLGDGSGFVYKQTRRAGLGAPALIDRAVAAALSEVEIRPFEPFGYDERQYNSPAVDLPVGRLTRSPHGEYPEYHTSGDDLTLLSEAALQGALDALLRIVAALEGNAAYRNPCVGEPRLGAHGLYEPVGGQTLTPEAQRALLWVLSLSDGDHDLLDTALRSDLPFETVRAAADRLLAAGLLIDD